MEAFQKNTYRSRFGSFNNALLAANLSPRHIKNISKEKVLLDIKKISLELSSVPTAKQYREKGSYDLGVIYKRFGSWDNALRECGFSPRYQRVRPNIIIKDLLEISERLNKIPKRDEFEKSVCYSRSYIRKYFSSYEKALKAAGLKKYIVSEVSKEDLINELHRLHALLGRIPKQRDFRIRKFSVFPESIFISVFGSFNNALREARLDVNHESFISNKKLIEELNRVGNLVSHSPTMDDFEKHGKYVTAVYQRRFGSWNLALIACGWEPNIAKGTGVISADGNYYESFGEAEIANILFEAKRIGLIKNYNPKFKISKNRYWKCDFLVIFFQNRPLLYIEYDGYGEKRPRGGYNRVKPKLEFYKENKMHLIIISSHNYKPYYGRLMSSLDFEQFIGLSTSKIAAPQKIKKKTAAILLDELRRIANEINHSPSEKEFKRYSNYPLKTYLVTWNSWQNTLIAAGLEKTRNENVTDNELILDLREIAKEIGHPPTTNDVKKHGKYSIATYQRKFSSYNEALKRANLEITKVSMISDNQLLQELRDLFIKLGRVPKRKDMEKSGKYRAQPIRIDLALGPKPVKKRI